MKYLLVALLACSAYAVRTSSQPTNPLNHSGKTSAPTGRPLAPSMVQKLAVPTEVAEENQFASCHPGAKQAQTQYAPGLHFRSVRVQTTRTAYRPGGPSDECLAAAFDENGTFVGIVPPVSKSANGKYHYAPLPAESIDDFKGKLAGSVYVFFKGISWLPAQCTEQNKEIAEVKVHTQPNVDAIPMPLARAVTSLKTGTDLTSAIGSQIQGSEMSTDMESLLGEGF